MKHREVKKLLAGSALGLAAVVAAGNLAPAGSVMAAPEQGDVDVNWGDVSDILGDGGEENLDGEGDNGGDENVDGNVDGGTGDGSGTEGEGEDGDDGWSDDIIGGEGEDGNGDGSDGNGGADGDGNQDGNGDQDPITPPGSDGDGSGEGDGNGDGNGDANENPDGDLNGDANGDSNVDSNPDDVNQGNHPVPSPEKPSADVKDDASKVDPNQDAKADVAPKTGDMGGMALWAGSGLAGLGALAEALRRKFRR